MWDKSTVCIGKKIVWSFDEVSSYITKTNLNPPSPGQEHTLNIQQQGPILRTALGTQLVIRPAGDPRSARSHIQQVGFFSTPSPKGPTQGNASKRLPSDRATIPSNQTPELRPASGPGRHTTRTPQGRYHNSTCCHQHQRTGSPRRVVTSKELSCTVNNIAVYNLLN